MRLSTRSLLIIMGVVAVAATALGAFIRSLPKDVQLRLAAYWGILIVIIIGVTIYHARKRYIAEQKAGRVFYVLRTRRYLIPGMQTTGNLLFGAALLGGPACLWIIGSSKIAQQGLFSGLDIPNIICGTISMGVGISVFWWQHVRLAEYGLVVRNKFVPWDNVVGWHWDGGNLIVIAITLIHVGNVTAQAPENSRAAVNSLFDTKRAHKKCDQQSGERN